MDAFNDALDLVEEGLELAVYGQNNTKHIEGCPSVPITCMRCVYDEDRKSMEAFLAKHKRKLGVERRLLV